MQRRWMGLGMAVVVCVAGGAYGGSLDSPAAPTEPGSAMYRLEDIYNRLDTGVPGVQSVFAEPVAGPTAGTGRTLNEVMAKAPATNVNAAVAAEVLSGRVFWGLALGVWGQQAGSMPNRGAVTVTPGTMQQAIQQGYHNGSGTVEGDTALITGNIKAGTTIFGVAGKTEVVDTTTGTGAATGDIVAGKIAFVNGATVSGTAKPAPVAKTGQTTSYAAGDDGALQKGVAWPNPRFTDNGNGTVTDNLTGLIWLKNVNAFGARNWATALTDCATLNSGEVGLSDESAEGDWRLPNVQELQSLIDYGRFNPALPSGHPFTGFQSYFYWSSSTVSVSTNDAWFVYLYVGNVGNGTKEAMHSVWPVRGGQ